MSDRVRTWLEVAVRWLRGMWSRVVEKARRVWQRFRERRRRIPIEALVVDRSQRRALERNLRAGLKSLRRALGMSFPDDTAVIVQQVITTDRQLAGCYHVGQRPNGGHFALIRLALQVNGRALTTDELLATLAEQCIGIAMQQSGGVSVVIPVELEPPQPPEEHRLPVPRPDPLAPHPNGRRSATPQRSA